jgi:hypothetical protein
VLVTVGGLFVFESESFGFLRAFMQHSVVDIVVISFPRIAGVQSVLAAVNK